MFLRCVYILCAAFFFDIENICADHLEAISF